MTKPTYEVQECTDQDGKLNYRVTHIKTDSRVATCYMKENADFVCRALNAFGGSPWGGDPHKVAWENLE